MVKNDFTCSHMKKSTFLDKENLSPSIDFIFCDRSYGLVVSRRRQVAIMHKNMKVQEVYVSMGLTGPRPPSRAPLIRGPGSFPYVPMSTTVLRGAAR